MPSSSECPNEISKAFFILSSRYDLRFRKSPSPYKTLIGTILSQRTRDEVTEQAEKRLFRHASTARQMLRLSEEEISKLIYPVGFYKQKARRIRMVSRILLQKYGGKVPMDRDLLMELPGVGGKTADCVLCFAFGKAVIPVDTHIEVIAKRLGVAKKDDGPEEVREKLHRLIPRRRRAVNWLLVKFGKEICRANNPRCEVCPIKSYCRYNDKEFLNLRSRSG
ncbi:MAG: endonuclease III domain-containing protein [Thermoproteota archaeon]